MRDRMRQLEDALATLQSQTSGEQHPLLKVKDEDLDSDLPGTIGPEEGSGTPTKHPTDPLEYFGTLAIREDGSSRFFGPSGGSEVRRRPLYAPSFLLTIASLMYQSLLSVRPFCAWPSPFAESRPQAEKDSSSEASPALSARSSLSPAEHERMARFSKSFPFTPLGPVADVLRTIRAQLPSWEGARALARTYVEHAAWLFRGLTTEQLLDDLLPGVYRRLPDAPDGEEAEGAGFEYADDAHALALLFNVFALATVLDFSARERLAAADHFNQIACAALGLRGIFDAPSIVTVQALQAAYAYTGIRGGDAMDRENAMEASWSYISLAAQVCQIVSASPDNG